MADPVVDAPVAESSPAPSFAEKDFQKFQARVAPPESEVKPTPAESAPAKETSEQPAPDAKEAKAKEAEPAPASEPEKKQEPHKGTPAPERVKELLADRAERDRRIADLERTISELKATKPASQPAKAEKAAQPQTRQKPTPSDLDAEGKPKYATYEDYTEAVADWKAEQKLEQFKQEQYQAEQRKEMQAKLDQARARYPEADKVIVPTAERVLSDEAVPAVIKVLLNESDILPDLLYVLGEKPGELDSFIELAKTKPGQAVRKLSVLEHLTREELAKPKAEPKVVEKPKAPEPEKPAPKIPAEVAGRNTSPDDVAVAAAQGGFTPATKAAWNAEFAARHR